MLTMFNRANIVFISCKLQKEPSMKLAFPQITSSTATRWSEVRSPQTTPIPTPLSQQRPQSPGRINAAFNDPHFIIARLAKWSRQIKLPLLHVFLWTHGQEHQSFTVCQATQTTSTLTTATATYTSTTMSVSWKHLVRCD